MYEQTITQSLPLISIIVAVKDAAKTMQGCIDSIDSQTYPAKELIIMDGGSVDGTVDILRANRTKIVYWESKADSGIYHAWNKALDHVRGEWVMFLGADDRFYSQQSLELISPSLIENRHKSVVFGKIRLWGGLWDGVVIGMPWQWSKFRRYMTIPHSATFHHFSLFNKAGRFDPNFYISGDYELLLRMGQKLEPVFVDQIIIVKGSDGVSFNDRRKSIKESKKAQKRHRVNSRLIIELWHLYYQCRVLGHNMQGK